MMCVVCVSVTIENNTVLKQTIKTRNEARRRSLMKKTASLNMESNKENRHAKITLLQDRKMVHGEQAANIFDDTYKETSNIPVEQHKNMCAQNRKRLLSLMMCQQ